MARYDCPIKTCNVYFEGSIWDIFPQAIGHAYGSHGQSLTEEDVRKEIEEQANPKPQPENKIKLNSWWKKING